MTAAKAATVFNHTFTFDGTAAYGDPGPPCLHEHSDTSVTIVHTPA